MFRGRPPQAMTTLALTLPLAVLAAAHLAAGHRDRSGRRPDAAASHRRRRHAGRGGDQPGGGEYRGSLLLWYAPHWRDYGRPYVAGRDTLYTAAGTITNAAGGRVTWCCRGTGDLWPRRLGYTLQLDLGGTARTTLAWGALHLPRVYA
jgi:hypothetical protein